MSQTHEADLLETLVDDLGQLERAKPWALILETLGTQAIWIALVSAVFGAFRMELFLPIGLAAGALCLGVFSALPGSRASRPAVFFSFLLGCLVGWTNLPLPNPPGFTILPIAITIGSGSICTVALLWVATRLAPEKSTWLWAAINGWQAGLIPGFAYFLSHPAGHPAWVYGASAVAHLALLPFYKKLQEHLLERELVWRSSLFPTRARTLGLEHLARGGQLPRAVIRDEKGAETTLADKRGKKIWLILYRYAGCPLCQWHMTEIAARREMLQKAGIEVVAVFESDPSYLASLAGSAKAAGVRVASDPGRDLYRACYSRLSGFGLLHPRVALTLLRASLKGIFQGRVTGDLRRLPVHFLISSSGRIADVYYGRHAVDQIPWSRVENFADAED